MHSVDELRSALARHAPKPLTGRRRAAVAVVVHDSSDGARLLFIERAHSATDPWSGQMAFPGGRVDPGDTTPRAAAERETLEEVGLDLSQAECLGQLNDLQAGVQIVSPLVLSSFVYRIDAAPALTPNYEVQQTLWVPLDRLTDPTHQVRYRWGLSHFPGIAVGEPDRHVVWGLTYQLLRQLFGLVGTQLPATS